MDRLATVILHYGDPELTQKVCSQLAGESDVFVFDNHAPQIFSGAWKRADENLYWSGALAFCLAEMQKRGFSHLWFLNNDIGFVEPQDLFSRLKTRYMWIERQVGKIGLYSPSVTHNSYHSQMTCLPQAQFSRTAYIDGIAPLIDLRCWQEIGLDFANNKYGYGVDVWFSYQAARAGWGVIVDHRLVIRHYYHSTAKSVDGFLQRAACAERAYLSERFGEGYAEKICSLAAQVEIF